MRRWSVVVLLAALARSAWAEPGLWVTAYYPGWRQPHETPDRIDFGAVTHLVHFAVVPRADGTLDTAVNMMTPANVAAAVSAAHAAGRKILFTVGGQNSRATFAPAISRRRRRQFVANLAAFLRQNHYDGVDLDMEEITAGDERDYAEFVRDLRAELDKDSPRPLLTAAALWRPGLFARLADRFDQVNLMTYALSGPWQGWVVWHHGALYAGGGRFPGTRVSLPSIDGLVEQFLAAGVPRAKLGVGLSFDGYIWSGGDVNRPLQRWSTPPAMRNVPYYELAAKYGIVENGPAAPGYHWDDAAQAPYLSLDGADPQFVTYQNETTAERLAAYARSRGLGGMIVWDMPAGYRSDQPEGRRDLLMQAVKRAALASSPSTAEAR